MSLPAISDLVAHYLLYRSSSRGSVSPSSAILDTSSRERSEQSLVRWAAPQLHDIDLLARMVDPALDGLYPSKSLSRFADIIAICVQVRTRVLCRYSCTKSISISSVKKKACFFVFFAAGAGVPPADVRGCAAAGAPDAEGEHHKAAIGRSGLLVQGPRPRRRRSSRRRPLTLRG